jgi:hypothetical protein
MLTVLEPFCFQHGGRVVFDVSFDALAEVCLCAHSLPPGSSI